jgi:serine/threonine/tyrosine-interacting protein
MILSNLGLGSGISKEFGNVTFMRTLLDTEKLQVPHQTMEWKYEQRRSAQNITPFLFLGPKTVAQNTDWIRQKGITMMISVRDVHASKLLARLLDPAILPSSIGIQTLTLDLNPSFDLMSKLSSTIKAINNHLEQSCKSILPSSIEEVPAKVLVFCESGNERSAAFVAAYLMVFYGVDAITAVQVVQAQRFCITIEDNLKLMLHNFQEILQAQRDVAASMSAALGIASTSSVEAQKSSMVESGSERAKKRSYDDAYKGDELMEDTTPNQDACSVDGRSGQAPFQDGP